MSRGPSALVLSGWAKTALHALDRMGIDSEAVLAASGVSRDALDSNEELPLATTSKLWRQAASASGDPAFGLAASRYVQLASLHGLAYAVQASATLRDALDRCVRYSRVVSNAATLRTEETAQSVAIHFHTEHGANAPSYEAMDAILSTLVRAVRMVTGRKEVLRSVSLRRPEPDNPSPYHHFFGVPVGFGTDHDALEFSKSDLDVPLPSGNAELARQNERVVASYLQRLREASITDRTRLTILTTLPSGDATLARIARGMAMSARSLQRQLAEAGTTFAAVLDGVRRDLAVDYLKAGDRSTQEIAFLLGFADGTGFSRAFKRWTGQSPSAFRARR